MSVPRAVLGCWLVFLLLTAVGGRFMNNSWIIVNWGGMRWYVETMVVSFLCGLVALATIIGGLMARSWVASWLGAVLLACIHTAVMIAVNDDEFFSTTQWATCSLWPAMLLSTCAPLVLLRVIFGWTLARVADPAIPRWKSGLEDLMIVGTVVASAMTITQVMAYAEGARGLGELVMLMLVFGGVSLLCIPVTVYVSFRLESLSARIAGWLALSFVAFLAIICAAAAIDSSWNRAMQGFLYICIGVPVGCLTVLTGILAMRASGYKLTYFASRAQPVADAIASPLPSKAEDEDEDREPTSTQDSWLEDRPQEPSRQQFAFDGKWQARLATAVVVLTALGGAIGIQLDKQREISFYRNIAGDKVRAAGIESKKVSALAFTPDFTDADMEQFSRYAGDIRELSLADTQVTDAILPKLETFPSLERVNLARTNITTAGLLRWKPLTELGQFNWTIRRLSLADTKVDWSALSDSHALRSFHHLDLSGLNINDQHLARPIPVRGLTLARNPITDAGIEPLLTNQVITHLDLSDTEITGSSLATVNCPEDLVLDGTQITDATLTAILSTGKVRRLSIARTKITAAVLPQLARVQYLRLGAGLITEKDLANWKSARFEMLWLNDKQFTGDCLKNSWLYANSINLSGSSVTDDTLQSIAGGRWMPSLGLADTSITDRGLMVVQAQTIDLRNTRVNVQMLKQRRFFGSVILSLRQFTPEQLSELAHARVQISDSAFSHSEELW